MKAKSTKPQVLKALNYYIQAAQEILPEHKDSAFNMIVGVAEVKEASFKKLNEDYTAVLAGLESLKAHIDEMPEDAVVQVIIDLSVVNPVIYDILKRAEEMHETSQKLQGKV